MTDRLPAVLRPGALTTPADTYIVPTLIADAGDAAGWRYVEFFTANIRNPHTRRAYARACSRFFAWCEDRGLTLTRLRGLGQFWIARPLLINGLSGKVFTTEGDWVAGRWRCAVAAEAAN
jgi:hypothetical protein